MKNFLHQILSTLAMLAGLGATAPAAADTSAQSDEVIVNHQVIDPATVAQWRQRYGVVQAGRYWYDADTGAWGREGGPTIGWVATGLPLPGPLPADASGGGNGGLTGVFINGRELHPYDVQGLALATGAPPWRGSWWMDATGNFGALTGMQHGPVLGNVFVMMRAHSGATGSNGPQWGIASPDGSQFIGNDGVGCFAKGSRGESYFCP